MLTQISSHFAFQFTVAEMAALVAAAAPTIAFVSYDAAQAQIQTDRAFTADEKTALAAALAAMALFTVTNV